MGHPITIRRGVAVGATIAASLILAGQPPSAAPAPAKPPAGSASQPVRTPRPAEDSLRPPPRYAPDLVRLKDGSFDARLSSVELRLSTLESALRERAGGASAAVEIGRLRDAVVLVEARVRLLEGRVRAIEADGPQSAAAAADLSDVRRDLRDLQRAVEETSIRLRRLETSRHWSG